MRNGKTIIVDQEFVFVIDVNKFKAAEMPRAYWASKGTREFLVIIEYQSAAGYAELS